MSKPNKMIEAIELLNKKYVCLFKIGTFYHTYGRDSYIISYLFNYKINMLNHEAGFPVNSLNKVIARLELEKINYITLDNRNNYDEELKQDYKNLNRYDKVYNKAREFININSRIENINLNLLKLANKKGTRKLLESIEKIIDENRKIQSNTND